MDLLAFRFNNCFVFKSMDALVTLWNQFNLVYKSFLLLQLLTCMICRIKVEGMPVIIIAPNWPMKRGYSGFFRLRADFLWGLPDHPNLLFTGFNCLAVEAQVPMR